MNTNDLGSYYNIVYAYNNGIAIGNDVGSGNNLDQFRYNGIVDEVRIWNTTRSDDEIKSDMKNKLFGTEEGLIGLYYLDEGFGSTVIDNSNSKNNGTIYNTTYVEGYNKFYKCLIKSSNQYYSIKSEFYDVTNDIYNPQLISELNADNLNTYGIDNLSEIHYYALNKLIINKYHIIMLK